MQGSEKCFVNCIAMCLHTESHIHNIFVNNRFHLYSRCSIVAVESLSFFNQYLIVFIYLKFCTDFVLCYGCFWRSSA